MSYIDKNLMKDEQIIYRASIHWSVYLWTFIWTILCVYISLVHRNLLGVLFGFLAVVSLCQAVLYKKTSEYVVTNKRLILKRGIISRKSVESMLTKCEVVSLEQSILGRVLGYGSLIVSTGGGVPSKFQNIKDPVIFRNYINYQIDEAQAHKPSI